MKRPHSAVVDSASALATASAPASAATQAPAASTARTPAPLNDSYQNLATNAAFDYFRPVDDLPYVTSACPGIGGTLKREPSHFRVIEIDDLKHHAPDGIVDAHGACHIYVTVTREGLNTADVQRMLADVVGLESHDIGVCGLKDKWARCTQTFSVPSYSRLEKRHLSPDELESLVSARHGPSLEVERTAVSSTKLRRNMHSGNRFEIVVSGIELDISEALRRAHAILAALASSGGIPNFYGAQRFSLGCRCALRGGKLLLEMQSCRSGSKKKRLRNSITRSTMRRFFLSAFSSMLFNIWLGRRIEAGNFRCLLDGDLVVGVAEPPKEEEKEEKDDEEKDTKADTEKDTNSSADASAAFSRKTENKEKKRNKNKEGFGQRFSFVRYDQTRNDCNTPFISSNCESLFEQGSCSFTGPMFGSRCPVPREGSEAYARENEIEALSGVLHTTYRALGVFGTRRLGRLVIQDLGMSVCDWQLADDAAAVTATAAAAETTATATAAAAAAAAVAAAASTSALLFSFSLPTGSYATAVLREFCKVPLRMEKADRAKREDEHERAKKKLKSQGSAASSSLSQAQPPEPMSAEELVACCRKNNIPFEGPRMALNTVNCYRILYLRGKRKPRRHSLVVFQPNDGSDPSRPRRGIKEWSNLLKYRHTARLSDEKGILTTLGCKTTALGPLSVCNRHPSISNSDLPPVTVGLERALVDAEEQVCWMKVDDNADDSVAPCLRLGLQMSAYIQLLRACGVEHVIV